MSIDRLPDRPARILAVALVLAFVAAGCRPFGPGQPVCGELEVTSSRDTVRATVTAPSGEVQSLRSSHVIQMQAVPTAEWGPCLLEVPRGWELIMPEPRSGEVELEFYSSGLGTPSLTVSLRDECEPTPDARRAAPPDSTAQRWVEVRERARGMEVAVVPVAARHEQAAYELATDLSDRELRGNRLRMSIANVVHGPAEERIQERLEQGTAVIVVDDGHALRDELELRLPDQARPITGTFGAILTELADRTEPPRYHATWWDVDEGSCTVFEFNVEGLDAASIETDVDAVIGRFPLGDLRRGLADHGYVIEPES